MASVIMCNYWMQKYIINTFMMFISRLKKSMLASSFPLIGQIMLLYTAHTAL